MSRRTHLSRSQKGKDGKRPRAFHRGRAQGRINESTMTGVVEPAYARAEEDRAEGERRAKRARREHRDWQEILAATGRVGSVGLCLPEALL